MTERRRKRALITRPQEDSADAAIALARRGITPVLAPMMRIEYAKTDIGNEVALAQAVLFTSRNGVRAFARLSPRRDITVLAVGDSTAALARDNGFVNVESAGGDSADLARLTIDRLDPANGLLFHAAGATVAGDLTEALNKAGFKTVRRTLYEAKALDALKEDTATALRDRTLDYVLFFSPRTGRIFADLVEKAGLAKTCDSLTAICLSAGVASEIKNIQWQNTVIAQHPTTASLLSIIATLDDTETPPPSEPAPATDRERRPETAATTPVPDSTENETETGSETETGAENPEAGETAETGAPVVQSTIAEEDGAKPQESAMTETNPAKQESGRPSEKSAETADAPEEPETSEMRDSAAALSAALASAPPASATSGRSRTGTVLVTLVAVIVVLGAGYATLPSWRDRLPPVVRDHLAGTAAVSEALQRENRELGARLADIAAILRTKEADLDAAQSRISAMEKQTDDLNARIAAGEKALAELRAANAEGTAAAAENTALKDRIETLNDSLAAEKAARAAAEAATQKAEALAAERAAAAGKLAATVEMTTGRIAGLEKELDTARQAVVLAGKADTVALAARKLRDTLDGAAPFEAEISALKAAAGDAPAVSAALERIEPLAPTGVATRSDLFARLPATVAAAVAAERRPKNDGWIDRTVAKLTGFVTVRRIDGKGAGSDAILARAEMAARRGDLPAAVTEISALTGPGAAAAAPWLKAAQARLAVDRARTALDKIVLTGVAAGDPS